MSVITCRSNVLRGTRSCPRQLPHDAQYNYVGGNGGAWSVTSASALSGLPLARVTHIDIVRGPLSRTPPGTAWVLSGLVRNTRYVSREDFETRAPEIPHAPKSTAMCAALIAIRRSKQWWELGHQVRREILETQSDLWTAGLHYLTGMVRRWQHRRDLSEQFDCVTWFEYEPHDAEAFDKLLTAWRASEEWSYVARECDIRLAGAGW